MRTPSAHVRTHWTTLRSGASLRVAFDAPVARLAYGTSGHVHHVVLRHPQQVVSLGRQTAPAGALVVAGSPRTWEQLPRMRTVTWFPTGASTLAVASPAPGATLKPLSPLRLTFSKPVNALGAARPTFATPVGGHWRRADSHTLVFTPTGTGFGLGATVQMTLPCRRGPRRSERERDDVDDDRHDDPGRRDDERGRRRHLDDPARLDAAPARAARAARLPAARVPLGRASASRRTTARSSAPPSTRRRADSTGAGSSPAS